MRKVITAMALTCMVAHLQGQTTEDALRASLTNFSGTARSMALGGAMGALGGDFTSLSINPAGVAVYRSSEFTFTPALHFTQTESDYYGTITTDDRFNFPLQQIGFVGTFIPANPASGGLVSTNWAIGYTRTNSFSRRSFIEGFGLNSSILDMFVSQGNDGVWDPFYNGLAYELYLLDAHPGGVGYIHGFEYGEVNGDGKFWGPTEGVNQSRIVNERGDSGEFNLSFGANYGHKFLIGGSLGITTFQFERELTHHEAINGGWEFYPESYLHFRAVNGFYGIDEFSFQERIDTRGTGVNLKIGAIYIPISQLRVGASFHTPTFYSFSDLYDTNADFMYFEPQLVEGNPVVFDGGTLSGSESGSFNYNFRTPFKAIGSLAYIFGNRGLISIDYEFTDYTAMQFRSESTSLEDIRAINARNQEIDNTFRATHNLRFGAEFRPTEAISLRGGYAIFQSPYHDDHFKADDKRSTLSAGLGFRMESMFVDVAYMLRSEREAYSLYYAAHVHPDDQLPATLTTNRHHMAVTLGWRF